MYIFIILLSCVTISGAAYCDTSATLQAKFALPKTAQTVAGDSNYVYVTFKEDLKHLYAYKLGSNGLPLGNDYASSTNVTVSLPEPQAESFTASVVYLNYLFLGTSPNLIYIVNTNTFETETVVNILEVPQFLAVDKFGFVYVSSGGELIDVFNFVGGLDRKVQSFDLSNGTQVAGCAIYVSSDDNLYFSFSSRWINFYQIQRDQVNQPKSLTKSGFVNENGCVFALTLDKYSSVVVLDGNVLDVSDTQGFENVYCLPTDVNTLQIWSDVKTGYAFFVSTGLSGNHYLYAVSYPPPEAHRV